MNEHLFFSKSLNLLVVSSGHICISSYQKVNTQPDSLLSNLKSADTIMSTYALMCDILLTTYQLLKSDTRIFNGLLASETDPNELIFLIKELLFIISAFAIMIYNWFTHHNTRPVQRLESIQNGRGYILIQLDELNMVL